VLFFVSYLAGPRTNLFGSDKNDAPQGVLPRAALSFLTHKGGVALETSMRIAGRLGAGLSPWEALSLAAQVAKADIETIVPFHL